MQLEVIKLQMQLSAEARREAKEEKRRESAPRLDAEEEAQKLELERRRLEIKDNNRELEWEKTRRELSVPKAGGKGGEKSVGGGSSRHLPVRKAIRGGDGGWVLQLSHKPSPSSLNVCLCV